MQIRDAAKLANKIRKLAGSTIFRVTFIKRSTGELRTMVCRLGVSRDVNGKGLAYDPKAHKLLTVFDVQKDGYRCIPLENLRSARIRGQVYEVSN